MQSVGIIAHCLASPRPTKRLRQMAFHRRSIPLIEEGLWTVVWYEISNQQQQKLPNHDQQRWSSGIRECIILAMKVLYHGTISLRLYTELLVSPPAMLSPAPRLNIQLRQSAHTSVYSTSRNIKPHLMLQFHIGKIAWESVLTELKINNIIYSGKFIRRN